MTIGLQGKITLVPHQVVEATVYNNWARPEYLTHELDLNNGQSLNIQSNGAPINQLMGWAVTPILLFVHLFAFYAAQVYFDNSYYAPQFFAAPFLSLAVSVGLLLLWFTITSPARAVLGLSIWINRINNLLPARPLRGFVYGLADQFEGKLVEQLMTNLSLQVRMGLLAFVFGTVLSLPLFYVYFWLVTLNGIIAFISLIVYTLFIIASSYYWIRSLGTDLLLHRDKFAQASVVFAIIAAILSVIVGIIGMFASSSSSSKKS
jgi:hypothetical protein